MLATLREVSHDRQSPGLSTLGAVGIRTQLEKLIQHACACASLRRGARRSLLAA